MLRISATLESRGVRLRLAGSLSGRWIDELQREIVSALSQSPCLTLDLKEVSYVDFAGVALLRSLPTTQIETVNGSAFLREQLASFNSSEKENE